MEDSRHWFRTGFLDRWRLFSILVLALFGQAAEAQLVFTETRVWIDSKLHDTQGVATFRFKNSGRTEIAVIELAPSCGCVSAVARPMTVKPGETGEVVATFEYGARMGSQKKEVAVKTDAPDAKSMILTVETDLKPILAFEPPELSWAVDERGKTKKVMVRLLDESLKPQLRLPESVAGSSFTATLAQQNEFTYEVLVTPAKRDSPTVSQLVLETGIKGYRHRQYTISLNFD